MKTTHLAQIERFYPCALEFFIALTVFFLPISKAAVEIGTTGALVLWLGRKFLRKEGFLLSQGLTVPYFTFLALCGVSLFSANLPEWQAGSRGILKWLQYMGFFALCAEHLNTPRRARRIIRVFLISMAIVTFNGFYQLASGSDFLRHNPLHPGRITRMTSSVGAPNTLAAFYLLALPLALTLGQKKKRMVLSGFLFLLFSTGFILTFSRAAFFGLLLAAVLVLLVHRKIKGALILTAVLGGVVLAIPPLRENFLASLSLSDISLGERLRYWGYTWEMIKEHPFFGAGLNLYYQKLPLFVPAEETYRGYAHNSYLQMAAEIGLIGLVAFLIPLKRLGMKLSEEPLLGACLSAGCLAFVMQAFFDNHFYSLQPAFLFWTFWGLFNGLQEQRLREKI